MKKFIFASDLHGDQANQAAVKALRAVTKDFKPDIRIFGGDLMDARPLRKGACKDEKAQGMKADWKAGISFLTDQWRPTHLLMGNHDKRIFDLAEGDLGIESEYAWQGTIALKKALSEINCKWLPYHKKSVFEFGDLRFLHGFFHGISACRQHSQVYGSCIFGHIHAIDQFAAPGLKRCVAMSAGALCNVDMKWNQHIVSSLRHANGFIMGYINEKTGSWTAWQVEEIDGKWLYPTKVRTA